MSSVKMSSPNQFELSPRRIPPSAQTSERALYILLAAAFLGAFCIKGTALQLGHKSSQLLEWMKNRSSLPLRVLYHIIESPWKAELRINRHIALAIMEAADRLHTSSSVLSSPSYAVPPMTTPPAAPPSPRSFSEFTLPSLDALVVTAIRRFMGEALPREDYLYHQQLLTMLQLDEKQSFAARMVERDQGRDQLILIAKELDVLLKTPKSLRVLVEVLLPNPIRGRQIEERDWKEAFAATDHFKKTG